VPEILLRSRHDSLVLVYQGQDGFEAPSPESLHFTSLTPLQTVHGETDRGFVARTINVAREKGVSAYIEGQHRWSAVHRLDAALVYKLALEKAPASSVFHAVAEEGVPTQDIANAIGKQMHLPVVAKSVEEAQPHFGFIGILFSADNPISSKQTQEQLGWHPTHAGLIEDIEQGHYFKE
jgi:nucleoside-diphosphate-sugar epimerase